jgi:hypothetical protein
VLIVLLPEWLRFLKSLYLAVYGLGVILIMVFLAEGIWGLLRNTFQRIHKPIPPVIGAAPPLNFDIKAPGDRRYSSWRTCRNTQRAEGGGRPRIEVAPARARADRTERLGQNR